MRTNIKEIASVIHLIIIYFVTFFYTQLETIFTFNRCRYCCKLKSNLFFYRNGALLCKKCDDYDRLSKSMKDKIKRNKKLKELGIK